MLLVELPKEVALKAQALQMQGMLLHTMQETAALSMVNITGLA